MQTALCIRCCKAFASPLHTFRVDAIRFCVVNSYLTSYLDTLCSMYISNNFFFYLSFNMQLHKTRRESRIKVKLLKCMLLGNG